MKNLKAICAAAVLSLALSIPGYAGNIGTPGAPEPPPPLTASEDISSPDWAVDIYLALLSLVI